MMHSNLEISRPKFAKSHTHIIFIEGHTNTFYVQTPQRTLWRLYSLSCARTTLVRSCIGQKQYIVSNHFDVRVMAL